MQRWWDALHNEQSALSPALQELTEDMLLSIGKHLGLPPMHRSASRSERSSELEQQLERTLGMLLGFESVRLAMMIDDEGESVGLILRRWPMVDLRRQH